MIARALMHDPKVVLLDEPTTGLDPQARRLLWEALRGLHERGTTFILTTHYMEEADRLCQRLAVVDHGKILTLDTPAALKRSLPGAQVLDLWVRAPQPLAPRLREVPGVLNLEAVGGRRGRGRARAAAPLRGPGRRPPRPRAARRARRRGRPAPREPGPAEPRGRLHPPHRAGAARMTAFLALLRRDLVVASRNVDPADPLRPHPADPGDPRLRQHPAAPRPRRAGHGDGDGARPHGHRHPHGRRPGRPHPPRAGPLGKPRGGRAAARPDRASSASRRSGSWPGPSTPRRRASWPGRP